MPTTSKIVARRLSSSGSYALPGSHTRTLVAALMLIAVVCGQGWAGPKETAMSAQRVLREACLRCHGGAAPESGFVATDRVALLDAYVTAGDPEASELWQRIEADEMPPERPLTDAQKAAIRIWIEEGAPEFPKQPIRKRISLSQLLTTIADDLEATPDWQRPSIRYLSLHTIFNDQFASRVGRGSVDSTLEDVQRAFDATAKLLNSLSWASECVSPKRIGPHGVVLRIRLDDYGWDKSKWLRLLEDYSFAVDLRSHQHKPIQQLSHRLKELRKGLPARDALTPFVRADWFVNHASRNELYYDLLDPVDTPELTTSTQKLEQYLGVDPEASFLDYSLARAGFRKSNVSMHNRMVERYATQYGAYWKSYDFANSRDVRDLMRFPLGPDFEDNPVQHFAFDFDGGEMIFSLPNGMQAYLLADAEGNRLLGDAPIEIVQDKTGASGGASVVNAVSCFACHHRGMIDCQDEVLAGHGLPPQAAEIVARLYPKHDRFEKLLSKDRQRYLQAERKALGESEHHIALPAESPEPIGSVAIGYQRDLQLEQAAVELGIETPRGLAVLIKTLPQLQALGIKPLLQGGGIKRTQWDEKVFQDLCIELDLGTPIF